MAPLIKRMGEHDDTAEDTSTVSPPTTLATA
jgi:hypothetical protein